MSDTQHPPTCLIAAAPELLEELEYAAGLLDIWLKHDDDNGRDCLRHMRAVIAKAKSQS